VEVVNGDWGTGMPLENVPDDVGCTNDSIGWLGAGVSVICTVPFNNACECQ
jgi:hypothetical protein